MGVRCCVTVLACACACGSAQTPATRSVPERVAADFEQAVKTSKDAYVALFDFVDVGEYEILLHRYDLNGRFPDLDDAHHQESKRGLFGQRHDVVCDGGQRLVQGLQG